MVPLDFGFGPEVLTLILYPILFITVIFTAYRLVQGIQEFDEARK